MPTAPETITLTPASAPGAPSTITRSAASAPAAPSTITKSAASAPSAPTAVNLSPSINGLIISGTLSPDITGQLYEAGELNGKMSYSTDGRAAGDPAPSGIWATVAYLGSGWDILVCEDGDLIASSWGSTEDEETPDLVETWTPNGSATGTPTLTLTGASAPSTITLTPASQPAAPGTITP